MGTLNCHHIWQVEVHCFFLSFSSSEIIRNQLSFSFDFYRSTVDELKAPVFQNLVRLLCNLQKQQQVPLNHWSRHASVASRLWHAWSSHVSRRSAMRGLRSSMPQRFWEPPRRLRNLLVIEKSFVIYICRKINTCKWHLKGKLPGEANLLNSRFNIGG